MLISVLVINLIQQLAHIHGLNIVFSLQRGRTHGVLKSANVLRQFRRALWAYVAIVGIAAYCDFPLQWVIGSPLSPTRSYISELSVTGQPAYQAFRIGDLIAGIGLTILAGALVNWHPSAPMRLGSIALTVTAITSIIDAMSPMTCAPSIDNQCWAADHAPLDTQLSQLHTTSGVIGFAAVVIAMAAYGAELRHQPCLHRLGSAGLALATVGVVLGSIETTTVLAGLDWTGLFERIHVLIISAWLITLTITIARTTTPSVSNRLHTGYCGQQTFPHAPNSRRLQSAPRITLLGNSVNWRLIAMTAPPHHSCRASIEGHPGRETDGENAPNV